MRKNLKKQKNNRKKNKSRERLPASLINKLPDESGVYFLFQNNILVYIGKAKNLRTRVSEHIQTKTFDEVEYEVTHWSRSRELEENLLEDYFYQHNQYPHYNVQG